MKTKILFLSFYLFFIIGCSPNKSELFRETDSFVESLQTTYESYGILGGSEYAKTTSDGLYTITPVGRLINIKIQKVVENREYEELKQDLKAHYKCNTKVNDVYICQAGTVMIDCRN
ncbi:ABC transporter [Flavobacterium supellecticarium]|uniref:ABC transporter n=1 Tax=Flavobacterium supellecticarium TaxID=2565924 RepID=A0A4S4A0T5_9FLAO|nr:ABC transporter [Flavobacterium supellecticarium]THF51817.1 ABC transporter [Flavobacterium supellecticarium]